MSNIEKYRMHAISLEGGVIDPISTWGFNANAERMVESGSGRLSPLSRDIGKVVPTFNVQTPAIKQMLALTGVSMLEIDANPATLWLKLREEFGGNTATPLSFTIGKGVIIPRQIQATKKQKAVFSFDVVGFKDGANIPVQVGTTALGAYPALPERGYVLSHAVVEGITFYGMQTVTVDFGIQETTECEAGDPYVSYADIENFDAAGISFNCLKMDLLTSKILIGDEITSTATFYFQAIDPANPAGRLNSYIAVSMAQGLIETTSLDDENGAKMDGLKISSLDAGSGTSLPIGLDLAHVEA